MGGAPNDYGDPAAEWRAALESCVLAERSEFGRLLAGGPDILPLLHRLSTADLLGLQPGQGKPTVLTTPKGRIVERLFVQHLGAAGVLLVGGAASAEKVAAHLTRFTFRENTGLRDVTSTWFQFALSGPRASVALAAAELPVPQPGAALAAELAGAAVHVLGQDGMTEAGFSIVGDATGAPRAWEQLADAVRADGGRPAGARALEVYRVLCGLPAAGLELTEEHNPLEAGLWSAVSFNKGCYVGQEVVARLRTYDKVARALVGLELPAESTPPPSQTPLYHEDREVGRLTSAVRPAGTPRVVGLGYVKRRDVRPGLELRVGAAADGLAARLVELPFAAHV